MLRLSSGAWINQQVVSDYDTHLQFLLSCTELIHSNFSPPSVYPFLLFNFSPFLFHTNYPCLVLHCPIIHLSASRTYVKRNHAMQPVHGEGRRTLSSLNWPRCCLCPGPSPASWTRPQSSGWLSATCTCALLRARETRHGALWWRETATAAKVSRKEKSGEKLSFHFVFMKHKLWDMFITFY